MIGWGDFGEMKRGREKQKIFWMKQVFGWKGKMGEKIMRFSCFF